MKVRYFSDLHVEFQRGFCDIWTPPEMEHDLDTVCILAGDIDMGKHTAAYADLLAPRFKAVILVLGNHDMWGETLNRVEEKIREKITEPNVHLLQNEKVTIDGVEILGTTLWTDMDKQDPFTVWDAPRKMNDFRKIKVNRGGRYTRMHPQDWLAENKKAREFLLENLDPGKIQLVVTHHAPDFACAEGNLNKPDAYYYNRGMDGYIMQANTWIFGHTHHRYEEYLGGCHVLTNPMGYIMQPVPGFDEEALIEV